jgi:hypothetical protein
MALTEAQLRTLATVERVASILSILGVVTIIGTFAFSRHFRNPMHRLIFINAFYNLFDFIATMIATSGPAAGNSSPLCQFQGFCLQMFPMADVLWTLAMACDVFLVVYYQFDVRALRKLEIWYITIITSIVSIPAIVFLFIHTPEKGPMYGSVTVSQHLSLLHSADINHSSCGVRYLPIGLSSESCSTTDRYGSSS